jgi:hypothetical protein
MDLWSQEMIVWMIFKTFIFPLVTAITAQMVRRLHKRVALSQP